MVRLFVIVAWLLAWQRAAAAAAPPPEPAVVVPEADIEEEEDATTRPADLSYGLALGFRWISMPAFVLDLFTKANMPLSSWGTSLQLFRRKGNFDIGVGFTYYNLSPPDGNWLGKGRNASDDTDYVQFRDFSLYAFDVSFAWHVPFTEWVGMHAGAGIGIAWLPGSIWRTSNSGCTEANAQDVTQCHPVGVDCSSGTCNEQQLAGLVGPTPDTPMMPHRFREGSVPSAIPSMNLVLGLDFRIPKVRGWEAKIEGGYFATFFLGGAVAYTF